MFLCKRSLSMLSRFNDVLQSAADVVIIHIHFDYTHANYYA